MSAAFVSQQKQVKFHGLLFFKLKPNVYRTNFISDHLLVHGEDRRIPKLVEVFEAFPEIPINLDIKDYDPQLVKKVKF